MATPTTDSIRGRPRPVTARSSTSHIGWVATRMPVSPVSTVCSPRLISSNGSAIWNAAASGTRCQRPASAARRRHSSGASSSAAPPVRANATNAGPVEPSAIVMNRYDDPQIAASSRSQSEARRDMPALSDLEGLNASY